MLHLLALLAPVVGGSAVSPGDFPDVVLVAGWTGMCSGTLIAPDVVLTAGHCAEIDPKAVLVGSVDYGVPGGQLVAIASVTAYPDWQHAYDVAVITLAEPIAGVVPRAIAMSCELPGELRVIGFGLRDPGGSGASSALATAMVRIDDPECTSDPACDPAIAPGGELVAGGAGATACFGDSGGPLLAGGALVGVVSRATGEASTPCGGPAVYERADRVVGWIEQTTGRAVARTPCAFDAPPLPDGCAVCPGASPLVLVALRRRRR
jgi:trypsin